MERNQCCASVQWDFTGNAFLARLTQQFAAAGHAQRINTTLLPGLTPPTMLLIFFIGGLTTFNIIPGIIMGFGIVMNNSTTSFAYFAIVQNQVLANLGLTLTMMIVVAILYHRKEFTVLTEYFTRA